MVALERTAVIERQMSEAAFEPGRYAFVAKRALQQMEVPISIL